jgi:hypothetical protein
MYSLFFALAASKETLMKRAIALVAFLVLTAAALSASNAQKSTDQSDGDSQGSCGGGDQGGPTYCPQTLIYTMTDMNGKTWYFYQGQTCGTGMQGYCPIAQFSVNSPLNCGGNCDCCGNTCISPYTPPAGDGGRADAKTQPPINPTPTSYADMWTYCSPSADFVGKEIALTAADKDGRPRQFRCVYVTSGSGRPPLCVGIEAPNPAGDAPTNAHGRSDGDTRHHVITDGSGVDFHVMSWDDI